MPSSEIFAPDIQRLVDTSYLHFRRTIIKERSVTIRSEYTSSFLNDAVILRTKVTHYRRGNRRTSVKYSIQILDDEQEVPPDSFSPSTSVSPDSPPPPLRSLSPSSYLPVPTSPPPRARRDTPYPRERVEAVLQELVHSSTGSNTLVNAEDFIRRNLPIPNPDYRDPYDTVDPSGLTLSD